MKKPPWNKIEVTPEQEKFIRDNYLALPVKEVVAATGLNETNVRTRAYAMGLFKMKMEYWTDDQVEFLEFVYRDLGDTEISDYFQKHCPKDKPWSKKHIEKKRRYLKLKRTKEMHAAIKRRSCLFGAYAVGNAKMWETRGVSPVGTVKIWKRADMPGKSIVMVKTETGYVHRNPWLWEQHYGPVPGGFVVYADPKAPAVCDIADLSLKTRAEMAMINADLDVSVLKRTMKITDEKEIAEYIENYPHLIELKRNERKLNGKLHELRKKSRKP